MTMGWLGMNMPKLWYACQMTIARLWHEMTIGFVQDAYRMTIDYGKTMCGKTFTKQ